MTFAILGGGQLDTGGYTIDNSLRFNSSDSPYLSRTPGTSGDQKKWTFSCWFKKSKNGASQHLWSGGSYSGNDGIAALYIHSGDTIYTYYDTSGTNPVGSVGPNVLRDTSAWYHIVWAVDAANTEHKIWLNGELISTDPSKYPPNFDYGMNRSGTVQRIGGEAWGGPSTFMDGYMAEVYHLDGQYLTADTFAEADEDSGIWKPKDSADVISAVTFGTNGFYLDYEDSGSLGADQSGNGNNFTPTNLASTDQTTDTPTNNFATLNPLSAFENDGSTYFNGNYTMEEGNLQAVSSGNAGNWGHSFSTIGMSSGKWYWEVRVNSISNSTHVGVSQLFTDGYFQNQTTSRNINLINGSSTGGAGAGAYNLSAFSATDILMIALDMDNGEVYFGRNGTWGGSGNPATGTNPCFTGLDTAEQYFAGFDIAYTGSFSWNFGSPDFTISSGNSDENGYGNFEYSVPSGYLALCTQNLATELSPTIDDGSQYFNTFLYTGNGTNPRSLTGVGFQPDFTWIKNRTDTWGHGVADSTRGGGKTLITNSNAVEQTNYTWGYVDSFDSDGFTVDDGASGDDFVNQTGDNYVSWNWLANGGSTSSNTDGSITSTVQANPTAGFSIVTYSGNQTDGATVGHGLGIAPQVVIVKERNGTSGWIVKHTSLTDAGYYLVLNATDAESTVANVWSDTDPSSTVFTLGDNTSVNENTLNYVAYCFAEIEGYSKFGSYTGNGSTNGTFVYTGFRPAFVLWKRTDGATDWRILDTTRDSFNVADKRLFPNTNGAENTAQDTIDFLSNGFKHRATNSGGNASGNSYIYMCFAENPFATSTGVAGCAR